jgi:tight adherence protein C
MAAIAIALAAGSVAMLALALYQGPIRKIAAHLQGQMAGSSKRGVLRALECLAMLNRRFLRSDYERAVRQWLVRAGEPRDLQPASMMALQELGGLLGLLAGMILCRGAGVSLFLAVPLAAFGAGYPLVWLRGQVAKRQKLIVRALPFTLDLLTLSVEAGLDFGGALAKVVEKGKGGPLQEEVQLVLKQLKVGKTREEALKDMMTRVNLPVLSKFVTAVILADRMGSSLGKVLRSQATQLRVERTQRAEKLASQAPVKMLLPLVVCIFPTVFLVLFGPIVFSVMFGSTAG